MPFDDHLNQYTPRPDAQQQPADQPTSRIAFFVNLSATKYFFWAFTLGFFGATALALAENAIENLWRMVFTKLHLTDVQFREHIIAAFLAPVIWIVLWVAAFRLFRNGFRVIAIKSRMYFGRL